MIAILQDDFVEVLNAHLPLQDKSILEIGCGIGRYTGSLAKYASRVWAIDPDNNAIERARTRRRGDTIEYQTLSALDLSSLHGQWDIVLFSLSLHHIPKAQMFSAIEKAAARTRNNGHVVFVEPKMKGSFYDFEVRFWASDGDERLEKQCAHDAIRDCEAVIQEVELSCMTEILGGSIDEFVKAYAPKGNHEMLRRFLRDQRLRLQAPKRIDICRPNN